MSSFSKLAVSGLLVIGGSNGHALDHNYSEFLSLPRQEQKQGRNCGNPPQFPHSIRDAISASVHGDPVICGGTVVSPAGYEEAVRECWILKADEHDDDKLRWKVMGSLTEARAVAAAVQIDSDVFWVTGELDIIQDQCEKSVRVN